MQVLILMSSLSRSRGTPSRTDEHRVVVDRNLPGLDPRVDLHGVTPLLEYSPATTVASHDHVLVIEGYPAPFDAGLDPHAFTLPQRRACDAQGAGTCLQTPASATIRRGLGLSYSELVFSRRASVPARPGGYNPRAGSTSRRSTPTSRPRDVPRRGCAEEGHGRHHTHQHGPPARPRGSGQSSRVVRVRRALPPDRHALRAASRTAGRRGA